MKQNLLTTKQAVLGMEQRGPYGFLATNVWKTASMVHNSLHVSGFGPQSHWWSHNLQLESL